MYVLSVSEGGLVDPLCHTKKCFNKGLSPPCFPYIFLMYDCPPPHPVGLPQGDYRMIKWYIHALGDNHYPVYECWRSNLSDIIVLVLVLVFCFLNYVMGPRKWRVLCFFKFSHCCIFQTCRTFAVMFCLFDLKYLQLQQNLFMLPIKKCCPWLGIYLAHRRPPTFFHLLGGQCWHWCQWSLRLRYLFESKRNCIYTSQQLPDVKKWCETVCQMFFPVSSKFLHMMHQFEAIWPLKKGNL